MGITSYAQNFEDVILWRVLGQVEGGTYVDVGAHHPDIHSVSRAFYERGWRGVHVEPGPAVAQLLREKRLGEIVVEAMVSEERGARRFYETPGGGLSTADEAIAQFHLENGNVPITETVALSITLDDVFALTPEGEIHWLKIDVEGFESQVLLSWATSVRRPWVVVVEATYPKTRIPTYEQWEEFLLRKGYEFVYDDGLNRYYLSNNHQDLRDNFSYPPNVFDDFQIDPSGSSLFSKDMKGFMDEKINIHADRVVAVEHELSVVKSDRDRLRATNERWSEVEAREKEATARLARQEHLLAEQRWQIDEQSQTLRNLEATSQMLEAHHQEMAVKIEQLAIEVDRNRLRPWLACLFAPGIKRSGDGASRSPAVGQAASAGGIPLLFPDDMTLDQLLTLPDDYFLRIAYEGILGREADETGMAFYRRQLERGRSRTFVLVDLAVSTEAGRYAAGEDLIHLSDSMFVDAIYSRFLGREVDPGGRRHYLEKLLNGEDKKRLIVDLKNSPEGQLYRQSFRRCLSLLVRRKTSFLGWRGWFRPKLVAGQGSVRATVARLSEDVLNLQREVQKINATERGGAEQGCAMDVGMRRALEDKINLLSAAVDGIDKSNNYK